MGFTIYDWGFRMGNHDDTKDTKADGVGREAAPRGIAATKGARTALSAKRRKKV